MNLAKISNVNKLSAELRLDYFIRKVADFESLWIAINNGGDFIVNNQENRISENTFSGNRMLFPVFPESDFLKYYLENQTVENKNNHLEIKEIKLDFFLDNEIPRFIQNNIEILVFPIIQNNNGVIISPERLKSQLIQECQQYE